MIDSASAGWPRLRSFPLVLSDVYTGKGTASLGVADTGHAWWRLGNPAAAALSVISGKLTNATSSGLSAGYDVTRCGDGSAIVRIGGRFTLSNVASPGTGAAVFVIWNSVMTTVNSIPDSGFHLTVGATTWALSRVNSGSLTVMGSGSFSPALATDGTTVLTVDCTISGTTATLGLPDGSHVVTDAAIASLAGPFACFEVYQGDAATETKPAFTEVWATGS